MPLALITIGSQVCTDYKVIIIDARIHSDVEVDTLLSEHLPNALLVGVTSLTGAPLLDAIAFTEKIKKLDQSVPVVWGGWHTSLFPEQVLEEINSVDITVQGQGEITFKEIVECLENGSDLSSVKGIVFRKDGVIQKNAPRLMEDMNDLPRLNYDLIDVERYFKLKGRRQFDFITSIGCFFRCTFCADPFVFNRKYSGLLPERLIDDLAFYWKKYAFTDLNFQDETFFTYKDRIVEMANLIVSKKLTFTWAATMRADQGSRMTIAEFKKCKEAGLRRLLIGVESGSQEMLDKLKKDIKLVQVLQCADWCKELCIAVIFPFIIGFPDESNENVEESKEVIKRLAFMSPTFETPIFYFKPYPGTQITHEVVSKGEFVLPESILEWAEFDYVNSRGPWLSDSKYAFFEQYKFYLRLLKYENKLFFKPIVKLARWRIKHFNFNFAFEKSIIEKMRSKQKLS